MRRLLLLPALLALGLGSARGGDEPVLRGRGATGEKKHVLLELYSSQGCSSCPSAERFVNELSARGYGRDRVVPAAFHVDYWDYLGWKDPFARHEWTERQTAFDRAIRASNLYTPQLAIDGADAGATGDAAALDRALRAGPRATLALEAVLAEKLSVKGTVAPLRGALAAGLEVEVLLLEDDLSTRCERGENGGRTLDETAVVRGALRALLLRAESAASVPFEATLEVPRGSVREKLHVAAILRDSRTWTAWQALDVALVASR